MKKVILMMFVACVLQVSAQAQNKTATQKPVQTVENNVVQTPAMELKSIVLESDLGKELTEKYGADFSLESKNVIAHLNSIVDNKDETIETRRMALYALFGRNSGKHAARLKD